MENPVEPYTDDIDIKDRIDELRRLKEICMKECSALSKELTDLETIETKKEIIDIMMTTEDKLIDLLVKRVLDPSPDWKRKIDTLINISNSMKGKNTLLGGSYFEALFQLAIAIGEMPQFKNVKQFYDIKEYKLEETLKNYIYTKTIQNSGRAETGIADIMFEIDVGKGKDANPKKTKVPNYSCGNIPQEKNNKEGNPFYFITVKGFRKEKSIAQSYDIPLLDRQIQELSSIQDRRIVVCVRNKEKFMQKLGRTKMDFIKNSIHHVIGYNEVMDVFDAFRTRFFVSLNEMQPSYATIRDKVEKMFPKTADIIKPSLSMYFHQELVARSVVERIQDVKLLQKGGPHFMCIGVLPRGGKSFIAGGIIDRLRKQKPNSTFNVLFLSSAISETIEQFEDDLIRKYAEFSDFAFIDARSKTRYDPTKNSFVFMSRQLTSQKVTKKKEQEQEVIIEKDEDQNISLIETESDIVALLTEKIGTLSKFDICFFDEAHVGISSDKVKETFNKAFNEFKMPIVMMTATYLYPSRVLSGYEDLFVWDTSDIQDMRKLPVLGFNEFLNNPTPPDFMKRQPELVKSIIEFRRNLGETEEQIAKPYIEFPNERFISLTFNEDARANIKELNDGFRISEAFRLQLRNSPLLLDHTNYEKWGELLTKQARESALCIRQYLTPVEEPVKEGERQILVGDNRKYRALNQIFQTAYETGSRPIQGKPFSILMFLPNSKEDDLIGEVCRVWASFLMESPYWRNNFVFLTISVISNKKYKPYTVKSLPENVKQRGILHREDYPTMKLKELIQTVEYEALKLGKGLVILSGDVGKMGISLKCVDVVCLFTDTTSPDDIIQKSYRARTDDPPSKKNGFIIDFNIKRTLIAKIRYSLEKLKAIKGGVSPTISDEETKYTIERTFEQSNWGQDAFIEDLAAKGLTLDDINQKLKGIILDELFLKTYTVDKSTLINEQVKFIFDDKMFGDEVIKVLKNTKTDKESQSGEDQTLIKRNEDISDPLRSNAASEPIIESEPQLSDLKPSQEIQLTEQQIKAKMGNIIETTINSLVIKSSNRWDTKFSFKELIKKFEEDEVTASKKCNCDETVICKTPHTNLYDIVYCELKPYAYSSSKKYIQKIHEGIMNLITRMFKKPVDGWQIYMDNLAKELDSKKGGRRKSWKKRPTKNNGRKTHRNGA